MAKIIESRVPVNGMGLLVTFVKSKKFMSCQITWTKEPSSEDEQFRFREQRLRAMRRIISAIILKFNVFNLWRKIIVYGDEKICIDQNFLALSSFHDLVVGAIAKWQEDLK